MFQVLWIVDFTFDETLQFLIANGPQVFPTIDSIGLCCPDNVTGNHQRHISNTRDIRVKKPATEFFLGDATGETLRCGENHRIGDFACLGQDGSETETGEDVHIVTLSRSVFLALVGRLREW